VTEEEFEDTKGVIRIRKSKKDRHHNGQNQDEIIQMLDVLIGNTFVQFD
jgi:hypothetical protein